MEQMKTPFKRNFPRTKLVLDDKDNHALNCSDCDFYFGYPCCYGGMCDLSGRELPPNDGSVCKHFKRDEMQIYSCKCNDELEREHQARIEQLEYDMKYESSYDETTGEM